MGKPGPKIESLLDVFTGTESNVGWVYASVDKIATEMAGYPWETLRDWQRPSEKPVDPPESLRELLVEPSQMYSYDDWIYLVMVDLELLGNSYWLKDQRNVEGQPLELLRLQPNRIQVVVNKQDRKVGYAYMVGGLKIPFALEEVMHFRYPNPRNQHYGMGTLEGILRAVDSELAEAAHITGFFQEGAHLSGVLTIPETLGEDEFERLKRQYQEEFARATNTFRVLIAEGSTDFKPIAASPHAAGLAELRKLSKDEILSGFNIPGSLLGGVAESGELEEAMLVFGRSMAPKARRVSTRVSLDLTGRWQGLGFRINTEQAEPRSMKIKRGREMLGAGATLNESRQEAGLPHLDRPDANEPLVPGGLMPLKQVTTRPTQPRPRDLPNLGPDQPHLTGEGDPSGGQLPTRAVVARTLKERGLSVTQIAEAMTCDEKFVEDLLELQPAPSPSVLPVEPPAFEAPPLPPGFEDWSGWKAAHTDQAAMERAMLGKSRFLTMAVPDVQSAMTAFFLQQRRSTMERLHEMRGAAPRSKSQRGDKKALSIDELWNGPEEDERLSVLLSTAVDRLGPRTPMTWFHGGEDAETLKAAILDHVKGINETTRDKLREQIEEGLRRQYPVSRIANGYAAENYPGIAGVFDDATTGRAGTIARTETATLYNLADVMHMENMGQTDEVEVLDGIGDEGCAAANGQRWSLEEAKARALEHPNCVRTFVAIPREA